MKNGLKLGLGILAAGVCIIILAIVVIYLPVFVTAWF